MNQKKASAVSVNSQLSFLCDVFNFDFDMELCIKTKQLFYQTYLYFFK